MTASEAFIISVNNCVILGTASGDRGNKCVTYLGLLQVIIVSHNFRWYDYCESWPMSTSSIGGSSYKYWMYGEVSGLRPIKCICIINRKKIIYHEYVTPLFARNYTLWVLHQFHFKIRFSEQTKQLYATKFWL